MSHLRRHLRRFSGFASLAMLAFALLPTLSQVLLGAVAGQPWSEVCSVAARTERAAAPAPTPDGSVVAMQTDHCLLCGQGTGPLALAAVPAPAGALRVGAHGVPAGIGRAPTLPFTWAPTQPRAPPRTA